MAFDAFLKIDGIPGESKDDKHKDWIEITSFNFGGHQLASATASSSGGATTERVSLQDFSVQKLIDKASPKLYEYCCNGKAVKEITLEVCRAGGDKVKYLEVKMEQASVSSFNAGGAGAADGGFPVDAVSFNFGKIKWIYSQQKREDGTAAGNVQGGWDRTSNKIYA